MVLVRESTLGDRVVDIAFQSRSFGDEVLVTGQLARRFYRCGAGARSLAEVVATGIKKLEPPNEE
jgi:hypothetical protein